MNLDIILRKIENKAAEHFNKNANDYIVDGLLYCGNCHEPKQTRITFNNEERIVNCICACQKAKLEKEEAERQLQELRLRIDKMRFMGFPDEEMRKWNFAHDDGVNEHISHISHKYVENFAELRRNGKGLLLFGSVGTGKTFAAACIANALIDKGYPCLVTNFARITNTLQGMYSGKQAYIDSLNDFELLVIDDLASERDTEFMAEIVQNIIDSRYRAGKPLIITTNLTPSELKGAADMRKQRIYSRLFDMCIPIEVKGKDRRREHLKNDYVKYSDLLGLNSDDLKQ